MSHNTHTWQVLLASEISDGRRVFQKNKESIDIALAYCGLDKTSPPKIFELKDMVTIWMVQKRSARFVIDHLQWIRNKAEQFGDISIAITLYYTLNMDDVVI